MIKHIKNCDCFDCQSDPYIASLNQKYLKADRVDPSGRTDNADKDYEGVPLAGGRSAAYFLDSKLVARKAVNILKSPSDSAPVVISYPKGSNVGTIYSYVVRDGQVWWDVNYFSGKHAGWVKHDPALFDQKVIEQTNSQTKYDKKEEELQKQQEENDKRNPMNALGDAIGGTSDLIGSIFGNLKWIILAAVVLIILYFAYNTFKK